MDFTEILGSATSAILLVYGAFKLELVKRIVNKLMPDSENTTWASIFLLIIVAAVPTIIGFGFSIDRQENFKVEKEQIKQNNNQEIIGDIIKHGLEKGGDAIEKRKQRKQREDSVFEATKPTRWAYQIGDFMNDDDEILKLYKKVKHVPGVSLFKNGDTYFFFKSGTYTQQQFKDSIGNFALLFGNSETIKVVDLMDYAHKSTDIFTKCKAEKFGKRKNKVEIECYTILK